MIWHRSAGSCATHESWWEKRSRFPKEDKNKPVRRTAGLSSWCNLLQDLSYRGPRRRTSIDQVQSIVLTYMVVLALYATSHYHLCGQGVI